MALFLSKRCGRRDEEAGELKWEKEEEEEEEEELVTEILSYLLVVGGGCCGRDGRRRQGRENSRWMTWLVSLRGSVGRRGGGGVFLNRGITVLLS